MKKMLSLSILTASLLMAGGDIAPVETAAPDAQWSRFFKVLDGYVRAGYQHDDASNTDLAIGGKLHVETVDWNGISLGASFYTTNALGDNKDGAGVPFFGSNNNSYSILGEAYILGKVGNTSLKIGRQEIDTPYADTDDVGMVPNTFEAAVLTNTDLPDTTFTAAYVRKMAGVDAAVPEKFTDTGMDNGIFTLGIAYEGIENLALQGWAYDIRDSAGDRVFTYFDAVYGASVGNIDYEIGAQFATQEAFAGDPDGNAKIYGISASLGYKPSGLTLSAAYNKTNGTAADNGFGGGPFFTSAEQLTLAEAGADGKAYIVGAEWDASVVGLEGLSFGTGYFTLEDRSGDKAHELDLSAEYAFNDNLSINAVYSDIKDGDNIAGGNFKNTRIFINYKF